VLRVAATAPPIRRSTADPPIRRFESADQGVDHPAPVDGDQRLGNDRLLASRSAGTGATEIGRMVSG